MIDAEDIDWLTAARTFAEVQSAMLHTEHSDLHGDEFWAEALRRLFARIGHNWVTSAYCQRVVDMNRSQDRSNGERAKATLEHYTTEDERKMRESARECARAIRSRCNEATVPSRYRREGVLLAAGWLDGGPLLGPARASTEGEQ